MIAFYTVFKAFELLHVSDDALVCQQSQKNKLQSNTRLFQLSYQLSNYRIKN